MIAIQSDVWAIAWRWRSQAKARPLCVGIVGSCACSAADGFGKRREDERGRCDGSRIARRDRVAPRNISEGSRVFWVALS